MLTSTQIAALTTELSTDPAALGYAALTAAPDAAGLVTLLNDTTKGGTLNPTYVDAHALVNAVVASEYNALTQAARDLWRDVIVAAGTNGVRVNDAGVKAIVLAVWAAGTTTRTALAALQTRACSRFEKLFGENAACQDNDVKSAIWTDAGVRRF